MLASPRPLPLEERGGHTSSEGDARRVVAAGTAQCGRGLAFDGMGVRQPGAGPESADVVALPIALLAVVSAVRTSCTVVLSIISA